MVKTTNPTHGVVVALPILQMLSFNVVAEYVSANKLVLMGVCKQWNGILGLLSIFTYKYSTTSTFLEFYTPNLIQVTFVMYLIKSVMSTIPTDLS